MKKSLIARLFFYFTWSWWWESDPRPIDYESIALPLSHTSKHEYFSIFYANLLVIFAKR